MHLCLPQTMTKENLAKWITENQIDMRMHEEKFDLTKEEIQDFEHNSSLASRAMDELNGIKDGFMERLKEGTEDPIDFTIPPTKGLKALQANREFADAQIKLGHRVVSTQLYAIPYPETKKILFFDVEGNIWEEYSRAMNPNQLQKYDKPLMAAMNTGKEKKSEKKIDRTQEGLTAAEIESKRPSPLPL